LDLFSHDFSGMIEMEWKKRNEWKQWEKGIYSSVFCDEIRAFSSSSFCFFSFLTSSNFSFGL